MASIACPSPGGDAKIMRTRLKGGWHVSSAGAPGEKVAVQHEGRIEFDPIRRREDAFGHRQHQTFLSADVLQVRRDVVPH